MSVTPPGIELLLAASEIAGDSDGWRDPLRIALHVGEPDGRRISARLTRLVRGGLLEQRRITGKSSRYRITRDGEDVLERYATAVGPPRVPLNRHLTIGELMAIR